MGKFKIKFTAFDPWIKQLRADRGWRVEFDVPQSEYDKIKDLPNFQDVELEVEVRYGKENTEASRTGQTT